VLLLSEWEGLSPAQIASALGCRTVTARGRLHRARRRSFPRVLDEAAAVVRAQIASAGSTDQPRVPHVRPRHRIVGVTGVGVALAAAAVALFLTLGSSNVTPGVENAAAAIEKAATLTTASAKQSGTATVRITHEGQLWAQKTVRWNGDDLETSGDSPGLAGNAGRGLLVVDGMMYGHEPDREGWIELGSPASIDPGSGTTPTEYLAAVRKDVGGTTLRRIVAAMTAGNLATAGRDDGSTVYSGKVPAGHIATESGVKGGQPVRVFPFGYVAHDAAADPASPLDTAVTVGSDGVIREIAVSWGTWTYAVAYSELGSTRELVAPADARPLRVRPRS
jgi:Sigma-70, region 4